MTNSQFFGEITDRLSAEPDIQALFLGGSHGRSTADRYSDIDLVAIVEVPRHAHVAQLWRAVLEDLHTVVYWNDRQGRGTLLNAITEAWLRCDLYITAPADFVGRSRSTVKPLFDHSGIYSSLPDDLQPASPNPERVSAIIHEFIRVLGLMTVGVGRREYVTLVKGVGLLRDLLTDLMLEECTAPDRGGVLHLSRLLTAEQIALLESLPYPAPERSALIAANQSVAEIFFPMARRLADELGVRWPAPFAEATRQHIYNELGVTFDAVR